MQKIKDYVEANKDRFLEELFELLRFPSVSADPQFKEGVINTAQFVAQKLKDAGADNVEICPTGEDHRPKFTDSFGLWTL